MHFARDTVKFVFFFKVARCNLLLRGVLHIAIALWLRCARRLLLWHILLHAVFCYGIAVCTPSFAMASPRSPTPPCANPPSAALQISFLGTTNVSPESAPWRPDWWPLFVLEFRPKDLHFLCFTRVFRLNKEQQERQENTYCISF